MILTAGTPAKDTVVEVRSRPAQRFALRNCLRMRVTRALGTAVVMLFVHVTLAGASGRVFHENFEGGATTSLKSNGSNLPCPVVRTAADSGKPRSGAYMLQCNWDGAVAWNNTASRSTLVLNSWSYSREFLIRFWLRYDANVDRKDGGKVLRLGTIGKDMLYMGAQMNQPNQPMFIFFEVVNGVTGPKTYNGGAAGDGAWHKYEIYIKHDTGANDGILRVWNDGVLRINATNVRSVTPGRNWAPWNLMSNWSNNAGWEHDALNNVYWDDIEIFSDLGSGGTGSMSDATIQASAGGSQAAPTNLRLMPPAALSTAPHQTLPHAYPVAILSSREWGEEAR